MHIDFLSIDSYQSTLQPCHLFVYLPHTGVYALATVIYWCLGNRSKAESNLHQLLSTCLPHALHSNAVDEVLFGRAGFLSSLLFVKKHVGAELSGVSELVPAMRKVFDLIIESGKRSSGVKPPNTGLVEQKSIIQWKHSIVDSLVSCIERCPHFS